jgi:hypothetical protein
LKPKCYPTILLAKAAVVQGCGATWREDAKNSEEYLKSI